jgi:hypothetical protein
MIFGLHFFHSDICGLPGLFVNIFSKHGLCPDRRPPFVSFNGDVRSHHLRVHPEESKTGIPVICVLPHNVLFSY